MMYIAMSRGKHGPYKAQTSYELNIVPSAIMMSYAVIKSQVSMINGGMYRSRPPSGTTPKTAMS